jgi:hypothetical protein
VAGIHGLDVVIQSLDVGHWFSSKGIGQAARHVSVELVVLGRNGDRRVSNKTYTM